MVDCLKDYEEKIVECLCTADPAKLAEDLLKRGLLTKVDFDPYAPHYKLIGYLLAQVYKQLQVLSETDDLALFQSCLEVLSIVMVSLIRCWIK